MKKNKSQLQAGRWKHPSEQEHTDKRKIHTSLSMPIHVTYCNTLHAEYF